MTKVCNKCKKTLATSEFPIKRGTRDGLYGFCRVCKRESDKNSRLKRACSKPPAPKKCSSCGEVKVPSCYGKNKSKPDGLHDYCKPCKSSSAKSLYERDSDRILASNKVWRDNNKDKIYDYTQCYYKANKSDFIARSAKRRAYKLKATPAWLTKEQAHEIQNFYWLAQDLRAVTGEEYHVDHIVPLNGKNICGLHVPWNLQVLPADINLSKGNRYDNLA